MSDANRVALRYKVEATYNAWPSGNFQSLRYTSESLGHEQDTVESDEIDSTRQITDISRTAVRTAGEVSGRVSAAMWDDWLQWALFSATWSGETAHTASLGDEFSITGSNAITRVGGGGGDWTSDFAVGDFVRLAGFTTAANNGKIGRVTAVTTLVLTTDAALTNEGNDSNASVALLSQITNGTTAASFAIERAFLDVANQFDRFTGLKVNTFSLGLPLRDRLAISFGLMGSTMDTQAATGAGTPIAAPTGRILQTVDHVNAMLEAGSSIAVTGVTMQGTNNLRERAIIGQLALDSIGAGDFPLSGTLAAYMTTAALIDKAIDFTDSSLRISLIDSQPKGYVIDIPAINYTSGKRVVGGKNSDVIADMAWSAKKHASLGYTIRIARF